MGPQPLEMEQLRQRLRRCLHPRHDTGQRIGDHVVAGVEPEQRVLKAASVLVPLVTREAGPTVLLTRRTDHLLNHPGQVSFPGGRAEKGEDPVATALREAQEEIGLDPQRVEVLGFLDPYQTVTGFLVTPVVAIVELPFTLIPDPFEVAEVFEVPLAFILDPGNHQRHSRMFNGQRREFYVLPYRDYHVWGATAAMLVNLHGKLAGEAGPGTKAPPPAGSGPPPGP